MPQTTRSVTFDSVLSATFADREKGYFDQVTKQMPLWYWLTTRKNGYKKAEGERIEWAVEYKLNQREKSYSRADVADLTEFDNLTMAAMTWKHYAEPIIVFDTDVDVQNVGVAKTADLMEQKESSALTALREQLNEDSYLDGTGNSNKRIVGLSAWVSETPTTGTVATINRATTGNEYWRNILQDDGGVAAFSGTPRVETMRRGMNKLYTACGRLKTNRSKTRFPDLILCTEDYYNTYDDTLVDRQRFQDAKAADAGFQNVMFKGATMIFDEDCPADQTNGGTAEKAFFLHTDSMALRYAPKYNFKSPDGWLRTPNQHVRVKWIKWSGELTSTVCAKHGCHIGINAVA